ncbi:hypothetical protein ACSQ67_024433 [Phaseolus vulgaris]
MNMKPSPLVFIWRSSLREDTGTRSEMENGPTTSAVLEMQVASYDGYLYEILGINNKFELADIFSLLCLNTVLEALSAPLHSFEKLKLLLANFNWIALALQGAYGFLKPHRRMHKWPPMASLPALVENVQGNHQGFKHTKEVFHNYFRRSTEKFIFYFELWFHYLEMGPPRRCGAAFNQHRITVSRVSNTSEVQDRIPLMSTTSKPLRIMAICAHQPGYPGPGLMYFCFHFLTIKKVRAMRYKIHSSLSPYVLPLHMILCCPHKLKTLETQQFWEPQTQSQKPKSASQFVESEEEKSWAPFKILDFPDQKSQLKQMSHIDTRRVVLRVFGRDLDLLFRSPASSPVPADLSRRSLRTYNWGGPVWEKRVRASARVRSRNGFAVLVTGAAGFVGTHVSAALKRRGDGVLGIDNFNEYYDPSLKRARQLLLERTGVYIVEGDINDEALLRKLFEVVPFTHVMHLAAQAGVRYAMENPGSYVHSNIAGFVNLLEVCKSVNPQPAIVWASSSSVYGLNTKVPFSERDRTDQPASLYAATKKAGEEIAHTYNHIYGLSLTGLRFFTVYGPWGRPDMAYFFFTRDILKGRGSGYGRKKHREWGEEEGPAQLRVFNLGNTSPVPVSDLVGILERLLKIKAKRNIMKLPRNGDVQFTHANISYAQRELGYKPTTDLHSGLKKFVRWYLNYYSGGKKAVE